VTIGSLQEPIRVEHLSGKRGKEEASRVIYRLLSDVHFRAENTASTLGREFIRQCKRNTSKTLYRDAAGADVTYRKALIGAFMLGRYFSRVPDKTFGVMLPNVAATALVFMGLQLFKRVPALLNYSSGPGALTQAVDLADLSTIITSRQFLERAHVAEEFFSGRQVIFLEDLKEQTGLTDKMWGFVKTIFPGRHAVMERDDEKETAVVLYTSGSEGTPKGVCLSHENLISNAYQALSRVDIREDDYFLNALPIFHSFGLMFGIIVPILANIKSFLYVSPLHYRIVPEIAYEQGCTILCGTNTFLNGYAKKANPYDFYSMRYIFCGAEALSETVFERYAKNFGVRVMSGYGATECSPIISIGNAMEYEYGSVGMALPGVECRLEPVAGVDDKGGSVGKLYVRGKNVMKGYLKNEAANHKYLVEDQGWYDTGDIVEINTDGFIRIVGRLKRFAKISGEMISLTALEGVLVSRFGERKDVAVMAVPDEQKGERIIVLTNNPVLDMKTMRETLKSEGFSDLATPREVRFIKEIPKLGTGKTDYVRLKEIL
jgi:acyl-[acyl-carrier-protein]-phospholipid O-acyltransferase / long-chain-fatty-acid--[acyl-carrier-protein] ligase